jgi:lipopolysaccharide transport system permease protein
MTTLQEEKPTVIHPIHIQPPTLWPSINLRELWAFRDLLFILMLRDVQLRYKQTALGVAWVVLQPLAAALIFAAIFGGFAHLPTNGAAYFPFVFAGLLAWNMFAGALQRAGNSLVSDARLITKVYFPRLIIPLASCAAVLVDLAVSLVVMAVLLIAFQIPLTLNILALPAAILLTFLLALGASLLISALNVYYRDFMYVLPFLIQIWMYASPVVYSASLIPERFRSFYAINPMVGAIDAVRWALLGGPFPWLTVSLSIVCCLLLLVLGGLVFQRVEQHFADVI